MAESFRDNKWAALAFFVGISIFAGAAGSFFTASSVSGWYPGLMQPDLNPPAWVFGPVWTFLYITMGIAAFLVYDKGGKGTKAALGVFIFQLALNLCWSILFFGFRSPALGFIGILPLWASIAYMICLFHGIDRRAAYLIAPYLLWVSFASYLNFGIMALNP